MKNPFRNLDELQRDLGSIAVQVTQVRLVHFATPRGWQPAVNAFRCGNTFTICVDLAGVGKHEFEVRAEPRGLVIRGTRPAAEPPCNDPALQVLALEIDQGPFERAIALPEEIDPTRVVAEYHNGLLWIRLPLQSHA